MERAEVTTTLSAIDQLIGLVERLRGEDGCPWDKKQTAKSMAVYLLEETYELIDAITRADEADIREELGDVLFHIIFVARLFQEQGAFDIQEVARQNHDKMVRRHPHVFGEGSLQSPEEVKKQWQEIKKKEQADAPPESVLDSVPVGLPGLARAYRISERASGCGFDWDNLTGVLAKAEEEWAELKTELKKNPEGEEARRAVSLEFGDLLFTLVNVARFARIHPETALAQTIHKFIKRYRFMEQTIREERKEFRDVPQNEKDILWEKAKAIVG